LNSFTQYKGIRIVYNIKLYTN